MAHQGFLLLWDGTATAASSTSCPTFVAAATGTLTFTGDSCPAVTVTTATAGSLTIVALPTITAVSYAEYPSSTTYPGSTAYPGVSSSGLTFAAAAAGSLTLTPDPGCC